MAPVASSGREASATWDILYGPTAMQRRAAEDRYRDLLNQKKVYEKLLADCDRELRELRHAFNTSPAP